MSSTRRWTRSLLAAPILAIGLLGGAAAVWAAGALTQAEITACLDSNGYFFQAPAGRPCPGNSLTWNQQGPVGPQGVAGQQGSQGPLGPQGAQGPPGKPAPSSNIAIKVVKKTFEAPTLTKVKLPNGKWSPGGWGIDVPYLSPPAKIYCPSGKGWSATGAGYDAYYDPPGKAPIGRFSAALVYSEPIISQFGDPFGWSMKLSWLGESNYVPWKWWTTFYVVCVKLS